MFLYIHGFASNAKSKKVMLLKKRFNSVKSLDLSPEPFKAIRQLEDFITKQKRPRSITLVGSSLGGYYAMYLSAKYSLKAILINPSIYPYKTLEKYKNKKVKYYAKDEMFYFKESYLEQLKQLKTKMVDNSKILLLLQTGDEVLEYKEALDYLPNAKYYIESGGSHQFDNFENYFEIINSFYTNGVVPSDNKGIAFSLTKQEMQKVQEWADKITKTLPEDELESLGRGMTYKFSPYIFGTEIVVEYYNNELLVRVSDENDKVTKG